MTENVGCCCGALQACCHRPNPENDIIQGTFEIDHSPWFCLSAAGRSVVFRLYSRDHVDPSTKKGMESENYAYLIQGKVLAREKLPIMKGKIKLRTRIIKFSVKFEVAKGFGSPGALVIENRDKHEFFLKSASLKYIKPATDKEEFHFYCNSWVYPVYKTGVKRVFFINQLYLPSQTPAGLEELRQKELQKLRGGSKVEREQWDRVYEYDRYNDLGDPDQGREYGRPVLGGSDYPYPRRLKTGRPPCHNDHSTESRPAGCFETYVPPDERLSREKQEELRNNFIDALVRFLTPKADHPPHSYQECPDLIKKIVHFFVPTAAGDFRIIQSILNFFKRSLESSSHQDTSSSDPIESIFNIFSDRGVKEIDDVVKQKLEKLVPEEIVNEVAATATKRNPVNSQLPSIIAEEKLAWLREEEFGRQTLAGTNPVRIRRLQNEEFLPLKGANRLPEYILKGIKEAMDKKRAFILEHYDYLLPSLSMINDKGVCAYATRTILLASSSLEVIEPVAIELCLPDTKSNMVISPDQKRKEDMDISPDDYYEWVLAKFHVAANDAAYHQLASHWLHTHAVIEPFIIATRRQLSVMHPIHRLLDPHFKDTLHINALARGIFLNAGGILETTLFTGEYSMRLSSHLYKQWRFEDQALPEDLVKRGMAVKAEESLTKKKNVSEIKVKPAEKEAVSEIKVKPAEKEAKKIEKHKDREEKHKNPAGELKLPPSGIFEHAIQDREKSVHVREAKKIEEDEGRVERDENLAEIDENAVESDQNPGKTPDNKVTFPAGVKLILEDYPYAKDGTEIWNAIETWVRDYCTIFYVNDDAVKDDEEIRKWWSEIRNVGHVDQKDGWYDLKASGDLVKALTTLIWITSGLHAAVNFGQYAYAGWPLNRPMLLRKFIPKRGTEEFKELEEDPDKFVAEMLPETFQMAFVIAVMDLLSRHTSDEVYLGQRPPENKWEENKQVDKKFEDFRKELIDKMFEDFRKKLIDKKFEDFRKEPVDKKFEDFRKELIDWKFENFKKELIDKKSEDFRKELIHKKFEDSEDSRKELIDKFRKELIDKSEDFRTELDKKLKFEDFRKVLIDKKFEDFRKKLTDAEKNIMKRNKEYRLMNRWGNAKIPYKLLYPDTSKTGASSKEKSKTEKMDITGRGIPNSISI